MFLSMTGFSSMTVTLPFKNSGKLQLAITLKSLNSRFFEVNCKLPYALSNLETRLIKLFKQKLHRGNIFCTVHMSNANELTSQVLPSFSILEGYLEAVKEIKSKFNLDGQVSLDRLVSLPHVFELPEEPIDDQTANLVFEKFETLVEQLIQARFKEGQALLVDIKSRIEIIEKEIKEIELRAPEVARLRKETLVASLENLSKEQNLKNSDLNSPQNSTSSSTESGVNSFLYSQLEKIDIHEEIIRAKSHVENLYSTIKSDSQEHGKKLDFILQELFREINTMGAKCSDSQIGRSVINIKVELEKAREQSQNIV